jgi:AAA domain
MTRPPIENFGDPAKLGPQSQPERWSEREEERAQPNGAEASTSETPPDPRVKHEAPPPHESNPRDERSAASAPAANGAWQYHADATPTPTSWLIKGILPEIAAGLLSGQWGTFKTTVLLYIAACIMTGLPFAGKYRIKRPGAVLFLALEGGGGIHTRLTAVATHLGATGPLPFAWRTDCPLLVDKTAADTLCAFIKAAAAELDLRFHLPVVLIAIDTLIIAAGYATGEENDAGASQKIMTTLGTVAKRTGAMVLGIDHFGKDVSTGTRGSSAKEGNADVVLAILADRELSGSVKNTRLAMRKQREGISGFEIPFTARTIETGTDEDGDPITASLIDWQETLQQTSQTDARWPPSTQLLRRILMTALVDGNQFQPFIDGPMVQACDVEIVRAEFYKQHPADGDEKKKAAARRQAFNRAIKDAQRRELISSREKDGVQLVWLNKNPRGDQAQ